MFKSHQSNLQCRLNHTPLQISVDFRNHLTRTFKSTHLSQRTAIRSGANSRRSSPKQPRTSWDLRSMCIRTGLTIMMNISHSYSKRRTRLIWSGKMTPAPSPRQEIQAYQRASTKATVSDERRVVWQKGWRSTTVCRLQQLQTLFGALKTVYIPSRLGSTPLLSAYGSMLIKEQEALQECWVEHFSNLLNRSSSVNIAVLDHFCNSLPLRTLRALHQSLRSGRWFNRSTLTELEGKMENQLRCTKQQAQKKLLLPWYSLMHLGTGEDTRYLLWHPDYWLLQKYSQKSSLQKL